MRTHQTTGTRFGSVCSGIEAASVAWLPLGWRPAWFAEIEPYPCALLAHHYPDTPNHGDMTALPERILSGEIDAPDILCGGTPCQSFSMAGRRGSLSDARGNLALVFCEIADAIDTARAGRGEPPATIMWENVPGVLNTRDNAFGCFLGALAGGDGPLQPSGGRWTDAGCVYGSRRAVAWRTLDAQYFGLAQRRRRVYVVASARQDADPAEILFERDGLRRDTPPCRQTGETIAGTLTGRAGGGGWTGSDDACYGYVQPVAFGGGNTGGAIDVAACLTRHGARLDFGSEALVVHGPQDPCTLIELAHTLGRNNGCENAVLAYLRLSVRRLTPTECERLMGFAEGYTAIPYRGRPAADAPRYRALGNSWAVPVVRWIGERIARHIVGKGAPTILDPCCGSRMMWADRQNPDVIFGDIRRERLTVTDRSHGKQDGTRTLMIEPDVLLDFRNLLYPDGSFRLVVFDPPHLVRAGKKSWLAAKYGVLSENWRDDLRRGFAECLRVLEPGGVLIFKWNETQVKVGEVLALCPIAPLFGHISGRKGLTHWLVFMKASVAHCRRCGGKMKPGVAIEQTCSGSPDFPGGEVVTMSHGGPGKLIDCMKCEKCGWSTT